MNKTITINLGSINFYLDEEAYKKLDRYLKAVSTSIDPQNRAETMQDIETRIAELFLEDQTHQNDVIELHQVDKIISIMGQPEDYQVDETSYEEQSETWETTSSKKLYRDVDHRTLGGVCAGLSHFFGISRFWLRFIFVALFFLSVASILLIYLLLWAITPAATTTAEKLEMRGQKINIDNIERQVRDEFNKLKDNVQNADYSGIDRFFIGLKNALYSLGTVVAKIIGVLLIIVGGFGLLGILLSFLSAGAFTISGASWIDYVTAANIGVPFWVASALLFLLIGIPLFSLLWLGLKIMYRHLSSIGLVGRTILIGVWVLALLAISGLGIRQATIRAYDTNIAQTAQLPLLPKDTLYIKALPLKAYTHPYFANDGERIITESNGEKFIVFDGVDLNIKPTSGKAHIVIAKYANGKGYTDATKTAKNIVYHYTFQKDTLALGTHFSTAIDNGFKGQDVELTLYIPENQVFLIHRLPELLDEDDFPSNYFGRLLSFKNRQLKCLDCLERQLQSTKPVSTEKPSASQKEKTNQQNSEWYQAPDSVKVNNTP